MIINQKFRCLSDILLTTSRTLLEMRSVSNLHVSYLFKFIDQVEISVLYVMFYFLNFLYQGVRVGSDYSRAATCNKIAKRSLN